MSKKYRIRVSGKARENPDPAMLAQIVIMIGRRLHVERLHQQATGDADSAEDPPHDQANGDSSEPEAGPPDGK